MCFIALVLLFHFFASSSGCKSSPTVEQCSRPPAGVGVVIVGGDIYNDTTWRLEYTGGNNSVEIVDHLGTCSEYLPGLPDIDWRSDHASFVINDTVVVCGGFSSYCDSGQSQPCDCLQMAHTQMDNQAENLMDTQVETQSLQVENQLKWKIHSRPHKRRIGPSSCVVNSTAYLFGGIRYSSGRGYKGGFVHVENYEYLSPGGDWVEGKDLPQVIGADSCAVGLGEKDVLVTGGSRLYGGEVISSVQLLSTATGTWSQLEDMDVSRSGHVCGYIQCGNTRAVLVAGGTSNNNKTLASASILDINNPAQGWVAVGEMSGERHDAAMVVLGDKVLVLGGYTDQFKQHVHPRDTIEMFDVEKKSWSTLPIKMKNPRAGHSAVLVNGITHSCG